jgi:hypothetical protein
VGTYGRAFDGRHRSPGNGTRRLDKAGSDCHRRGDNRVSGEGGKTRIVGDVAHAEAVQIAGAITPVLGGVGPMTIACLLLNTLRAACAQKGLPVHYACQA